MTQQPPLTSTDSIRGGRAPSREATSAILERVYNDYADRLENGEWVDVEAEYYSRYPHLREQLRELIEGHRFLVHHPNLLADIPPRDAWPSAGDTFLDFHLLELLGEGALAKVFLAADLSRGGRQVVVKIAFQGRMESMILGRLRHPGIMNVDSLREDDETGLTAICIPYEGRVTLRTVIDSLFGEGKSPRSADAIRRAACEPGDAPAGDRRNYAECVREFAVQLAEALAYLHQNGVCYRDLKPSNVLVRNDGSPMLIDFNMAVDRCWGGTIFGGTINYMAPEQLRRMLSSNPSDPPDCDHRADLFALGVVLYELLTGRHPFEPPGDDVTQEERCRLLLERQQTGRFVPIRRLVPSADRQLCRIIEGCLAFRPEDRPQTAETIVDALRHRGLRRRLHAAVRRRPLLAVACAIAVLAGGVWAAQQFTQAAVSLYDRGIAEMRSGRHDLAEVTLSQCIEAGGPQAEQALFARGDLYLSRADQAKDAKERRFWLGKAHDDFYRLYRKGASAEVAALLGYVHQRQGNLPAARGYYEKALAAGLRSSAVLNNLALVCMQRNDLPRAVRLLDQARRADSDNPVLHHNIALAHWRLSLRSRTARRSDEADTHLRRAAQAMAKAVRRKSVPPRLHADAALIFHAAATLDPNYAKVAQRHLDLAIRGGMHVDLDQGFAVPSTPRASARVQRLVAIRN